MTKVSQYPLNKKVEEKMFEILWDAVVDLSTPQKVRDFFHDILTPTERLMIAKRFAIALLLEKGHTYKEIADILKVSQATISTTSRWLRYEGKVFRKAVIRIIQKQKHEKFWDTLDEFFTFALPLSQGTNWKRIRSEQGRRIAERRRKRDAL